MAHASLTVIAFSLLVALIEISSKSKASWRQLIGTRFVFYVLILILGNIIATALAFTIPGPEQLPKWLWSAFIGVFGFQAIIQNINVTFADKGFLTINDWINKARDSATADAVEAEEDAKQLKIQQLADRLAGLPLATLNTQLTAIVGPTAPPDLARQAQEAGLDEALLKALTLAATDYKKASQITIKVIPAQ